MIHELFPSIGHRDSAKLLSVVSKNVQKPWLRPWGKYEKENGWGPFLVSS